MIKQNKLLSVAANYAKFQYQLSKKFSLLNMDMDAMMVRGVELKKEAVEHANKFEFQSALAKSISSKEISDKVFGSRHSYTADVLLTIAEYRNMLGYYEKASAEAQSAYDIFSDDISSCKPRAATALSLISITLRNRALYAEALKAQKSAYEIRKELYGENSIEVTRSEEMIGDLHRLLGDLPKSSQILLSCLDIREGRPEMSKLDKHLLLTHIGELYMDKGDYDSARYYLNKAIVEAQEKLGYFHPSLTNVYNVLSELELRLKEPEVARKTLETSMDIFASAFHGAHPHAAITLNNFGTYHYQLGEFDKARQMHIKALQLLSLFFPQEDHPQFAITYLNLGLTMREIGQVKQGTELISKSLDQLATKLSLAHPKTQYYNKLAHPKILD